MQVIPPPHAQDYDYLPEDAGARRAQDGPLLVSIRWQVFCGIVVVALIVAAFGGWASTAPLAGGAVAPGIISPDGSRRTIQHLEGGIIAAIKVRDGDFVEAGKPLVTLEDTQARATYEVLLRQYQTLTALRARLTAEQLGRDDIVFPEDLRAADTEPEMLDILAVQRHLFRTRHEALLARQRILDQRIRQIREKIAGSKAQVASAKKRLRFIKEELVGKEFLFNKGLIPKPELLAVRRAAAEIEGDLGAYVAAIAESQQKIGETELELAALSAERADEIADELDTTSRELARVKEQLAASEDTLNRTTITAPVSGTIVNLRFKTLGGVILQGDPILDIVPAEDDLLIDARVAPIDIDVVYPGLPAQVHLSAYSQRVMPRIEGTVRSVSADSMSDEQTGTPYYLARVEVDREQLSDLGPDIELVPGMPAEVLIVTSERTLFGYLLQPFRDLFRRGLREV